MMTLLQIVQTACDELGLQRPATVVNSTDLQVRQLLALTNRDGRNLQQVRDWTALQFEYIINVGAPVVTTGDVAVNTGVITNIPDTSAIVANYFVCTGPGIPVAARVQSVDSATQVTLNMEATGNSIGASLTFARDTYAKPDDFDRFINQTGWDRTNRWALIGPDSPQIDQWHRSGIVTTGPRRHFRQIGLPTTNYRLWPPPSTVDTPFELVFEYISQNWVLKPDGTTASSFTSDADMPILDQDAFILGVKWRFWQIKGFDYAALQQECLDYVQGISAQDGGARVLSLSRVRIPFLVSPANVQDSNFPGSASDMS